ncbi:DNA alkylation repair protein (plasmid) [Legionella adelaidensis]|uniref:DNA alkylation repair enzyme n=1 Tax=Legionella adelaidensis TaxID=45056 RepID=A0A0W0R0I6_9GAMM|nr:DNA alkylation repair protein [Legionella adelaidensis]KTC64593.1 DNA alkylation repair enzyme [Legionella adelaidensis]VEH85961.1 DNA alkylation repair protein [Legionella adelaidensis]
MFTTSINKEKIGIDWRTMITDYLCIVNLIRSIFNNLGWMLREMGKRDEKLLIEFLEKYANQIPRTMLRYSIEKLDAERKLIYLHR